MKNPRSLLSRNKSARTSLVGRASGRFQKLGSLLLSLMLVAQCFVAGVAAAPKVQPQTAGGVAGTRGEAFVASVNVSQIAQEDALAPAASANEPRAIHQPVSAAFEGDLPAGYAPAPAGGHIGTGAPAGGGEETQPLVPSPAATTNFLGLVDNQQVIPPDTMGAVGDQHVVTILNDRMRITDRAGNVIRTASTGSFWAPLAQQMGRALNTFDPKVYYDRYTRRSSGASTAWTPKRRTLTGPTSRASASTRTGSPSRSTSSPTPAMRSSALTSTSSTRRRP
jgi:hypothetical protein